MCGVPDADHTGGMCGGSDLSRLERTARRKATNKRRMENEVTGEEMTAKEFLEQYGEAVRVINRLQNEYDGQQKLIDSVRSPLGGDGSPHGGGVSKDAENKATKLADKSLELMDAQIEAIRIRQRVFGVINQIPGVRGDVLYERYINLRGWNEVAKAVGYSKSRVNDFHNEALDMIEISNGRIKVRTQSDT